MVTLLFLWMGFFCKWRLCLRLSYPNGKFNHSIRRHKWILLQKMVKIKLKSFSPGATSGAGGDKEKAFSYLADFYFQMGDH